MILSHMLLKYSFGHTCGSFQCVCQSSVDLPSFFSVDIIPLPSFVHFTNHFPRNPWLSCFTVDFPNRITRSIWHILVLFHYTSTFPLSHCTALNFPSTVSCTLSFSMELPTHSKIQQLGQFQNFHPLWPEDVDAQQHYSDSNVLVSPLHLCFFESGLGINRSTICDLFQNGHHDCS